MVWTSGQTTAFLVQQMGLTPDAVDALKAEGITDVEDLRSFEDDLWTTVVNNLKHPATVITPATGNIPEIITRGVVVHIGALSLSRLKAASCLVRYYKSTGRDPTPGNMKSATLEYFTFQWKALEELKKEQSDSNLPKLTKNLQVMKWTPLITAFWATQVGGRNAPLTYVIREDATVATPRSLRPNRPFSSNFLDIAEELNERLSHDHPVFRADNQLVYKHLEEATRTSIAAATVKQYSVSRDRRAAWKAVMSAHCNKADWEHEATKISIKLQSFKWKGNGPKSLTAHCNEHREMNEALKQCAEHFLYQLPNERTTVTQLLASIQTTNSDVAAALSTIKHDDHPNGRGMRNNFDAAVAFLIPNDPHKGLAKKKAASGLISDVGGKVKEGIGTTGVHLCFHKYHEFLKLSAAQKTELNAWRESPAGVEAEAASKKAFLAAGGTVNIKKRKAGAAYKRKQKKKINGQIATILAEYHLSQSQQPSQQPVAPPNQPPIAVPIIASAASTVSAITAHDATVNKLQSILRRG